MYYGITVRVLFTCAAVHPSFLVMSRSRSCCSVHDALAGSLALTGARCDGCSPALGLQVAADKGRTRLDT